MLTKEQKDDELIKSMLVSGFEESLIESWLQNGTLTLQKSTQYGPDDHGEGDPGDTKEKRADKGTEKRKKEDEEADEAKRSEEKREKEADKVEKGNGEEGDGEGEDKVDKGCGMGDGKPGDPNQLAKSLGFDTLLKSMEDTLLANQAKSHEEFAKSIPAMIETAMTAMSEKIEKSLEGMRNAITVIGNAAPRFKSDMSQALIEKSVANGGGVQDTEGKTALSISKDRPVVRALIMKSIEEEADESLKKSLESDSYAYLTDPLGGAVGEKAAKYLYDKKNVRLVQ